MLADKTFYYSYSQIDEHRPLEFCLQALNNSIKLDLGLGYFSSACINVLSYGMAHFIANNGHMNLYINRYLSREDYDLLKGVYDHEMDHNLVLSFEKLKETFDKRDEHFFQCLAYLIQDSRINIKIVVLCNGGLPHEKYGIFTDECGNKIYFNGSMNMTAAALLGNLETIECTCSWRGEDSNATVANFENHFNKVWNAQCPDVKVYEAKDFCNVILKTYPNQNMDKLLLREQEIIETIKFNDDSYKTKKPFFPIKYTNGPRPYQEDAYNAWVKNGKKGIFAMATGTGKTVTSLNCALHEFQQDEYYNLLILVPTLDLVEQWKAELLAFNFKEVICVSSLNPSWKREVVDIAQKIKRGKTVDFVIVSTYDSFVTNDFQTILPKMSMNTILIADEAHNIGGEKVKGCFRRLEMQRRIALSATPERIYDDEGSNEIANFFKDQRPYVFSFKMGKAIEQGRLCRYFYYPKVAYLNNEEMKEYAYWSKRIAELWDEERGKFTNEQKLKTFRLCRKRIIHKCADKLRVYKQILKEIGEENLKYTFVYAPQGKYDVIGLDKEVTLSEGDDISFIQKLLEITKETYPEKRCNVITSKEKKEDRTARIQEFSEGRLDVLLAMKCLDEGVDIPRAERGIFTSSTGNPREFIQRRGRLLRTHPEKDCSYIYDIIVVPPKTCKSVDNSKSEQNIVRSEFMRVAYFATLAMNYYANKGADEVLNEVAKRWGVSLAGIMKEINELNEQ